MKKVEGKQRIVVDDAFMCETCGSTHDYERDFNTCKVCGKEVCRKCGGRLDVIESLSYDRGGCLTIDSDLADFFICDDCIKNTTRAKLQTKYDDKVIKLVDTFNKELIKINELEDILKNKKKAGKECKI